MKKFLLVTQQFLVALRDEPNNGCDGDYSRTPIKWPAIKVQNISIILFKKNY